VLGDMTDVSERVDLMNTSSSSLSQASTLLRLARM
jgi:hypothetical protein